MKNKIVIGSRESRLAVIQAEMVQSYLQAENPQSEISILTMKTTGDKILNQALANIGGKGLFVKELDYGLLERRTDLSVHSLKDVPMELSEELPLVAFSKREDPRDVLVLPEGVSEIDFSKPIGCSSKRRMVQFQALYPQARFETIRGNVQTRLRRLDAGEFSATLFAAAGLKRLGLEHRISRYFSPEEMIPAAGQGILAVQGRAGEDYTYLAHYNDPESEACALAERAFVRGLGGGCTEPIASHAVVNADRKTLRLVGMYQDEETGNVYKGEVTGEMSNPKQAGRELANRILAERARESKCEAHPAECKFQIDSGKAGKVWLVGAGPSDPGLFTLKGREVLAEAEVVVYDALVGPSILGMIPEGAEAINVGKRSSHHMMRQEQISELLAQKAKEGKRVVRLKGGDPFLFGRGGEELEVLVREGIPYEVVPGVTSAIAVPAYQGIPVTHRDYCSSVHIITGHKRAGESYDIDFDALVRTKGTLIFLMGVTSLQTICEGLLNAGMNPGMPAALLAKGTTAAQERIVSTVAGLPQAVMAHGAITPAIIVVGEVCKLAEKFAWAEYTPLGGARVFVTRPKELAGTTSLRLRKLGAEVTELPVIETVTRKENTALDASFGQIDQYQWIVFTSPAGVRIFFEELACRRMDLRKLSRAKFAVIGAGSAKELEKHGVYADLIPEVFDGAHLGAALAKVCRETLAKNPEMQSERILIPRAAIGNHELTEALTAVEGVEVDDVATYDTVYRLCMLQENGLLDVKAELESGREDYVLFTSASTVKAFAATAGGLDYTRVHAVCIGKQTKAAADAMGMQTWMSEQATIDSLIEKLIEVHRQAVPEDK